MPISLGMMSPCRRGVMQLLLPALAVLAGSLMPARPAAAWMAPAQQPARARVASGGSAPSRRRPVTRWDSDLERWDRRAFSPGRSPARGHAYIDAE